MISNLLKNKIELVIFYNRPNKYSFNALLGAIEDSNFLDKINFHIERKPNDFIKKLQRLNEDKIKVIAISLATPQLWEIVPIIQDINKLNLKNKLIVVGGPHPTGDSKGCLNFGCDIVVLGEGEKSFVEILDIIISNQSINANLFNNILGVAYYDVNRNYHIKKNKERIDLDKYPPFSDRLGIYGPIEITRGCPFMCSFCQTPQLFGALVRHRSIDKICHYVELMKRKNLKDIRVITPNALAYGSDDGKNVNLVAVENLLSSIRSIIGDDGRVFFGSFPSEVRPEHVSTESLAILRKYINNDNLIIGAQSGSQRMLDYCHRGHSFRDVYKAVKLTIQAGFKPNVDFIFGLPGETQKDINYSLKMIDDLTKLGAKIHAHTFMPLPQTRFAKSRPGKVSPAVKKAIRSFTSRGLAYGDWEKQEELAEKISLYLKTGILNNNEA